MPHEAMGGGSSRAQVAWHAGAALVALALELAIVLLLFFSHDGRAAAPRIFALFGSTRSSMADLVVLDVAKAMLVLLGGLVAAHLGRISASDVEGPAAGADGGASEPLPSADDVIVQPLLLPGAGGRAHTSSSSAPAPVAGAARNGTPSAAAPAAYGVLPGGTREPHAGPSAPPPAHPAAAAEPGQALSFDAKNRANARRQGMVGAVFLVSTAFQMFVGIKTIQFDFVAAREREDGALLGILVLLTNVSTWFVVRAVREATKEDGFVVPEFHPHALYHRTNLALHHCDLCSERGTTFFSCRQCGFDVCPRCFARKDKRTSEGLLRNDRGFQEPAEFTTWQYVTRTASLVRGHVPLFLVAIGCLVATTLAQLFLPNYQGAILDAIVQSDVHGFKEAIVIYLGISVASGLLNAVRSLCFNVAMRQIGMSLRKALFAQIIAQDMARALAAASGRARGLARGCERAQQRSRARLAARGAARDAGARRHASSASARPTGSPLPSLSPSVSGLLRLDEDGRPDLAPVGQHWCNAFPAPIDAADAPFKPHPPRRLARDVFRHLVAPLNARLHHPRTDRLHDERVRALVAPAELHE